MTSTDIKLAVFIFLSSLFASLTANSSEAVISNLLTTQSDFFMALLIFLTAVSLFLFIHYLLLATNSHARFYWLYYSILIFAVITTLIVTGEITNLLIILINILVLIATVLMVHLRFKSEYNNMIKPHLGIASGSLTYIMFAIALLSTVNFYHVGTSPDAEDDYYKEFKTYILNTVDTTTKTYMEKAPSQLNALGSNLIRTQVENIFIRSIDRYAAYFMLLASLIVFITMISLGPLVRMFIWFFNAVLLGQLIRSGVIKSEKVTIEAEKLSL